MSNQSAMGRGWEWALAAAFARRNDVRIRDEGGWESAQNSYARLPPDETGNMDAAALAAVEFLEQRDQRLRNLEGVTIQTDHSGRFGDPRDLLLHCATGDVGVSAKNRHTSVKHSRLSDSIDFGDKWYGVPCSQCYWDAVKPSFQELRQQTGKNWKDITDKKERYYQPVLNAFVDEVRRAVEKNPGVIPELLQYVTGRHSFYQVIKVNGDVEFLSFRMDSQPAWGSQLPLPTQMVEFRVLRENTAELILDNGWALRFRLHNARSRVEPSLKFDITMISSPDQMSRHKVHYEAAGQTEIAPAPILYRQLRLPGL